MEDEVFFSTFVTKDLRSIDNDQRFFEGYLTVQVKDKQGEITIVKELMKVLPIWMDRGAPISDTHSNRIIGRGINYSEVIYKDKDGEEYPAIKITGKIHKNYELDNEIWKKIVSKEYKGLSFGGATKSDRTPKIMKDGSIAYELRDLEHYEVAVCRDPAVPLALITDFNPLAKSMETNYHMRDDKMVVQCNKWGCTVSKTGYDHSNSDGDSHVLMHNQDVEPSKSSGRKSDSLDDDFAIQEKRKDGDTYYGGVRHSSKEYETSGSGAEAQITEVKDNQNDEETHDKETKEHKEDKEKSAYQTEAGNNQQGSTSRGDKDSYKNDGNYINMRNDKSDKDMEDNKESENVTKEVQTSEVKKEEEVVNSFQESVKANLDTLTDVIKSLAETQKDVSSTLEGIDTRLQSLEETNKALEKPTDFPLKPATSTNGDDVGAKVVVPDTYQSNSKQVGLDDDRTGDNKPKTDPKKLRMQEKSDEVQIQKSNFDFTTDTPRPSSSIEDVSKSGRDISLILKDARESGDLSQVGRDILAGKYYTPTPEEVGQR